MCADAGDGVSDQVVERGVGDENEFDGRGFFPDFIGVSCELSGLVYGTIEKVIFNDRRIRACGVEIPDRLGYCDELTVAVHCAAHLEKFIIGGVVLNVRCIAGDGLCCSRYRCEQEQEKDYAFHGYIFLMVIEIFLSSEGVLVVPLYLRLITSDALRLIMVLPAIGL